MLNCSLFSESRRLSLKYAGSNRDTSMDEAYWQQLASVTDEKKERVWDAMIDGFEKYSQVLSERATLIHDTDALKQQVNYVLKNN